MDEKFIDEPDSSEEDSEEEEKHGYLTFVNCLYSTWHHLIKFYFLMFVGKYLCIKLPKTHQQLLIEK